MKTIKVRDLVRITTRMKNGDRTFEAIVTSIETMYDDPSGRPFHYVGYEPTEIGGGLFGYTRIYLDGPRKYGVQNVEVLAHDRMTKGEIWNRCRRYPKPGDRGYDLMC